MRMNRLLGACVSAACVSACLSVSACGTGDDDNLSAANQPANTPARPTAVNLETTTLVESDSDGIYTLAVAVAEGQGAILIDVVVDGNSFVSIDFLDAPDGSRAIDGFDLDSSHRGSTALRPRSTAFAIAYPLAGGSEILPAGTWTLQFGLYTPDFERVLVSGRAATVSVVTKADEDLERATIRAQVVYVDGVEDDDDLVAGIDKALAYWTDLYARYGIALETRLVVGDVALQDPGPSNSGLDIMSRRAEPFELTLLLGEALADRGTLGRAGNIPGGFLPSGNAGIVVAVRTHAGVDGDLNDDEAAILGNTMAHEVGHYLGLNHPVESSFDFAAWDLVDDTPECTSRDECVALLGDNLMYPDTVSGVAQEAMTSQQLLVMHSSIPAL